jgi:hypothetical protein
MLFKRKATYYLLYSSCCCACRGGSGSGAVVHTATSIRGAVGASHRRRQLSRERGSGSEHDDVRWRLAR